MSPLDNDRMTEERGRLVATKQVILSSWLLKYPYAEVIPCRVFIWNTNRVTFFAHSERSIHVSVPQASLFSCQLVQVNFAQESGQNSLQRERFIKGKLDAPRERSSKENGCGSQGLQAEQFYRLLGLGTTASSFLFPFPKYVEAGPTPHLRGIPTCYFMHHMSH